MRISKRLKKAYEGLDRKKSFSLSDAIDRVQDAPEVKFDETVELHLHLNIDGKKTDQIVRGTVILPHGTGKKVRIAVFCKGEKIKAAQDLGADHVGAEDLIEKVSQGFLDFDRVIATPDMMRDLSKLGKTLGPRGLMPSPKTGTVTMDIERAIREVKAGKIDFKSDKLTGIHVGIGKRSFQKKQLLENAHRILEAIEHVKPGSVKGNLIKGAALSTTMGPGIKIAL